jgi:hypothetical protein
MSLKPGATDGADHHGRREAGRPITKGVRWSSRRLAPANRPAQFPDPNRLDVIAAPSATSPSAAGPRRGQIAIGTLLRRGSGPTQGDIAGVAPFLRPARAQAAARYV